MILLSDNFMFFKLPSGESVPFSAEMISVELSDGAGHPFDQDFVHHAAASVFHYFKNDLGRKTVSVAEFASAFESVLNGLGLKLDSGRVAKITDDAANKECCELFSGIFRIPPSRVHIVAGQSSRTKTVMVEGVTPEAAAHILEPYG